MEKVMMASLRLHVPIRPAEYMTGIDKTGRVYVRTPQNYEDHNKRRIYELRGERGFETLNGESEVSRHLMGLAREVFPLLYFGRPPLSPSCAH